MVASVKRKTNGRLAKNGYTRIPSDLVLNTEYLQLRNQMTLLRLDYMKSQLDGTRDLNKECNYPTQISSAQYRELYNREGIPARVVSIYPDECFAVEPEVYESERTVDSPLETSWKVLVSDPDRNPLHYLHRLDVESGIGHFGIMLIGVRNSGPLYTPLAGVTEQGGRPRGRPSNPDLDKLNFFRVFDESQVRIKRYDTRIGSPRYGKPESYFVKLITDGSLSNVDTEVHWTRVIHAAENAEVFAPPRMENVYNRLLDTRKILGGSAEMFWKGGFPGYSFEMDPAVAASGATFDKDSLERQFWAYSEGLQRFLAVKGVVTRSLAPQVADPTSSLMAQLQAIALAKGIPLRIFMGSEQAQLASGQDVRTWNRRLLRRQNNYLTPKMFRPLIDRLILIGILPAPLSSGYKIFWPDINIPSEDEKSGRADRLSSGMMKYMTGAVWQIMGPKRYMITVLGLTQDEATEAVDELGGEEAILARIKIPAVMQAEAKPAAAPIPA